LFAGISGLRAHQTMMDVVGNNIANINTTGYKSSDVVFEDTLSQTINSAGSPQSGQGGTNPSQVGLGVKLGGIVTNFAQGATQLTGRATDLAIQGDGFFAVRHGAETLYTRDGSFQFDANGTLTTTDGDVVQGWNATAGVINTNAATTDLKLPLGTLLPPKQTGNVTLAGNVPSNATPYAAGPPETGTKIVTSITAYDGQGNAVPLTFQLTADNTADSWTATVLDSGGNTLGTSTMTFDPTTGNLATPSPARFTFSPGGASWGGKSVSVDINGVTEFGGANTLAATSQDGSAEGSMQSFTIGDDGTLVGVFSNGLKQSLGRISLAAFNNPPGLEKVGGSLYRQTVNSGTAVLGTAGNGGRGTLAGGTLEMSNVDLAQEFSYLIMAQRGFQANARVITTSDEVLQDLVQLKR
jgi:flagellar hook protein FlgE